MKRPWTKNDLDGMSDYFDWEEWFLKEVKEEPSLQNLDGFAKSCLYQLMCELVSQCEDN